MRHAHHLALARERRQFLTEHLRGPAADAAYAAAGPEYEAVGVLPKGVFPLIPRYPGREAIAAKIASEAIRTRADAELNRKKAEVESKLAQSQKLAAEAQALQAALNQVQESPAEAESKPKKSKK